MSLQQGNKCSSIPHRFLGNIRFERVTDVARLESIARMVQESKVGEIPFTALDFISWAVHQVENPNVFFMLVTDELAQRGAGFSIGFGPWELDRSLCLWYSYVVPDYRRYGIPRLGFDLYLGWAYELGINHLVFETPRPRAWQRLLGLERTKLRAKIIVEV